jgi:Holliday junction DNA helicase RuvA
MYSFISGTIEDKSENSVIVCNNGIGYEIFVSANTLGLLENIGEQTKLYTYLHVREDAFLLFGFLFGRPPLHPLSYFLLFATICGSNALNNAHGTPSMFGSLPSSAN